MCRHFKRKSRAHAEAIEHEHTLRIAQAEDTLRDLTERGVRAIDTLDARDRRNHWQEAVQELIKGIH